MMEADTADGLISFRSVVDDPRQRPDPFVLATVAGDVRQFYDGAMELGVNAEFTRRMTDLVVEVFRQLDALPRDEEFWDGTNRRPTQYKLADFCEKLLRDRPDHIQALWMLAAVSSVIGLGFPTRIWTQLMVVARPEAAWPIGAALCGECLGGADTSQALVLVLTEADSVREALPELYRIKDGVSNIYVQKWAGRVINKLNCEAQERNG